MTTGLEQPRKEITEVPFAWSFSKNGVLVVDTKPPFTKPIIVPEAGILADSCVYVGGQPKPIRWQGKLRVSSGDCICVNISTAEIYLTEKHKFSRLRLLWFRIKSSLFNLKGRK